MRTTGSTTSRFDKQCAVKSSGMPRSRRDNAVRGNPPTPTKIKMSRAGYFVLCKMCETRTFYCKYPGFVVKSGKNIILWRYDIGAEKGG